MNHPYSKTNQRGMYLVSIHCQHPPLHCILGTWEKKQLRLFLRKATSTELIINGRIVSYNVVKLNSLMWQFNFVLQCVVTCSFTSQDFKSKSQMTFPRLWMNLYELDIGQGIIQIIGNDFISFGVSLKHLQEENFKPDTPHWKNIL